MYKWMHINTTIPYQMHPIIVFLHCDNKLSELKVYDRILNYLSPLFFILFFLQIEYWDIHGMSLSWQNSSWSLIFQHDDIQGLYKIIYVLYCAMV